MQGGWQPPPGGGSGYGAPPPGYGPPQPGYGPPGMPPNPYAAPGAQPTFGAQYGNYEFNELENGIIDKCASRAKMWGWISASLGALQLLGGGCGAFANPGMAAYVPAGIVALIVGISFIGVGNSLKAVVDTQGNDLAHMMSALEKLGGAFLIQAIASIIMIVLVAIVVLFMVFAVAVAASR